jgi:hypothetical protein
MTKQLADKSLPLVPTLRDPVLATNLNNHPHTNAPPLPEPLAFLSGTANDVQQLPELPNWYNWEHHRGLAQLGIGTPVGQSLLVTALEKSSQG